MMIPTILKRGAWLGVVALGVALVSCRDFDEAYEKCVDAGTCIPDDQFYDAGTDGGTTPGNDAGMDGGADAGPIDAGPDGGSDAGPTVDAGMDAGPTVDAGMDAGPTADAGPTVDAGMDAGPTADAGPTVDAGMDAGPTIDAGMDADAGPTVDAGTDAGPVVADSGTVSFDGGIDAQGLNENECASGLCLRHKYVLSGPYEFQGLWGSSPDEIFLAARARPDAQVPAQVVRFSDGRFSASTVDLPGFQPFRLQGTDPSNVWAINEAPASGPCWLGDEPLAGANANPLMHCPSPLFRFDGQRWAPVGYVTSGRTTIQPPALYTGPDSTWVASSGDGLLQWTGSLWQHEPAGVGADDQLSALWGDSSGLRLGVGSDSHQRGAFRQRSPWGAWTRFPSLESEPFVAIAGPDEKNLYAATASEVLRWMPGGGWQSETLVPLLNWQSPAVQDLWVSADGNDVWVTLKTSYVLRKHGGQWSVVHLPVDPGFSALQVEGFDSPTGDLWITGTGSSSASFGTTAYHYERQEP